MRASYFRIGHELYTELFTTLLETNNAAADNGCLRYAHQCLSHVR